MPRYQPGTGLGIFHIIHLICLFLFNILWVPIYAGHAIIHTINRPRYNPDRPTRTKRGKR